MVAIYGFKQFSLQKLNALTRLFHSDHRNDHEYFHNKYYDTLSHSFSPTLFVCVCLCLNIEVLVLANTVLTGQNYQLKKRHKNQLPKLSLKFV